MNMEMLKFLTARSATRLYPWCQLECAIHLPNCPITVVSFPNWVCHFFEFLQTIVCELPLTWYEELQESFSIEFLSVVVVLDGVLKARCQDQDDAMNQHLREEQLDHEYCVVFVSPVSSYLTSWISGRDSCLVGVSCHSPRFMTVNSCISEHASC